MSAPAASDKGVQAPARVVGSASVFLRPLRYLFDVEALVDVAREDETVTLPFARAHVHVRAATRPPLVERDEPLSGFLRAESPIRSSIRSARPSHRDGMDAYKTEMQQGSAKHGPDDDGDLDAERELRTLRGTFVWLFVRLQPVADDTSAAKWTRDLSVGDKRLLRVQYQVSPASESFCLPVDHTNVVKLLVTDELLEQVDAKELQFSFLSVPPTTLESAASTTATTAATSGYNEAELAASEAAVAEEVRRRQRTEEELEAARRAAQEKDRERLEAQLQAKLDAKRAQELEVARSEQVHARELLQQELASRKQQNQELEHAREKLEAQLHAASASAQSFQTSASATDQAIELLKQRAASDAKEREELQRRLRLLEEEKLALQRKSRACVLQ